MRARVVLALLSVAAKGLPPVQVLETRAPSTLHPLWVASSVEARTAALLYDDVGRLEHGEWTSAIGQITTSDVGLTLQVRRDLRWHDGTRASGEDVCATIAALHSETHPNPVGQRRGRWVRHCQVDPSNPQVARLVLTDGANERALSFPLLPAHLSGDLSDPNHSLSHSPMGTGPWLQKSQGVTRRLSPHRSHSGARPTILLSVAPEDDALALSALTSGGVDGMTQIRPGWVSELRADPHLRLTPSPLSTAIYAAMNPRLDVDTRVALTAAVDRAKLCGDLVGTWDGAVQHPCLPTTGPYRREDSRYNQVEHPVDHLPLAITGPLRVAIQAELEIDAASVGSWLKQTWAPMDLTVEITPLQRLWNLPSEERTDQWDVVIANLAPDDLPAHFHADGPANWFGQVVPIDVAPDTANASSGRALHAALDRDTRWLFLVQLDGMSAWSTAHTPVWMTPWSGLARARDWGWFSAEAPDRRPRR